MIWSDWFPDTTDRIERDGVEMQEQLTALLAQCQHVRTLWAEDIPWTDTIDDFVAFRDQRRQLEGAVDRFASTVKEMRIGLVRTLVDVFKLSFTDAGKTMGITRQQAQRLYRESSPTMQSYFEEQPCTN